METGNTRGFVVLTAVIVLIIGGAIAWYVIKHPLGSNGTLGGEAPRQEELPPPTVDVKTKLYQNLQSDGSTTTAPLSDTERTRVLQQMNAEQSSQTQAQPTPPSTSDRQKLLQSLGN